MIAEGVTIDQILYSSYVKYDRLSKITFETYGGSSIADATNLNVYIDLYSIMHSIFSEHNRTVLTKEGYTSITSCIINMVVHYREFFRRMQVHTNFFLVFSFNTCDINRKFVAEYNETFKMKSEIPTFAQITKDNFELLDILCPYLPDIYFIKSVRNYESSVIISHLIENYGRNIPNLIISKDLYPVQLCALYPYTSYLYPRKFRGEDLSSMISINEKITFRYDFWKLVTDVRKISIDRFEYISPINFPLLMALTKFPERDINKSLCNIPTACKIISDIVGDSDIKVLPGQLYSTESAQKYPIARIEAISNTLDVTFMKNYYEADPESKSIRLDNLRDDAAVNSINAKFFANNPIDLSRL